MTNYSYVRKRTYKGAFVLLLRFIYVCVMECILHYYIFISCLLLYHLWTMYAFYWYTLNCALFILSVKCMCVCNGYNLCKEIETDTDIDTTRYLIVTLGAVSKTILKKIRWWLNLVLLIISYELLSYQPEGCFWIGLLFLVCMHLTYIRNEASNGPSLTN